MTIERAKEIILGRISTEIFLGHNAIGAYIAISDHASTLNASPFRQAFGLTQRNALGACILSLCKLYERPNKRYPNYSIPTTLELLKESSSSLSVGIQNCVRLEEFIQAHIDPGFSVRDATDSARIPTLILDNFSQQCPCIENGKPRKGYALDIIWDALKVLRDKRVAHDEAADLSSLSKINLDGVQQMLAFAQTYVNIVGYGFFGFCPDGEAYADRFEPAKSDIWAEWNQMIELLERQNRIDSSRAG